MQPLGELARVSIGETNFTSNRVELSASTEEIFPGEDKLGFVAWEKRGMNLCFVC